MKNSRTIILSALLGISVLSGCTDKILFGDSFLEKQPGVDITQDTIFSRREFARRFLWTAYSKMYYALPVDWSAVGGKMNMGIFEVLSDCWHSHLNWDYVNTLYYSGTYNASWEDKCNHTRFGFTKENCWEAIRASWLFIENVDRVPDMSTEEKLRLKAEAKVIIASRYFDMFRHFGGLPIVEGTYPFESVGCDLEGTPYYIERATVENTVNFMIRLLDEASVDLPWRLIDAPEDNVPANWEGRFTKASAMGLKCKILLFAASPLFNDDVAYCSEQPQEAVEKRQVWYGGYKPELWDECLQACKDFFAANEAAGNPYHLCEAEGDDEDAYRAAFRNGYFTRDGGSGTDVNPEMLISTRVRYTWSNEWDGNYYFPQSYMYGAFTPTQEYVEMFPWADGTPFDWNDEAKRNQMFKGRDPRLYETILVEGARFQGRQIEMWVGGREMKQGSVTETSRYATGYAMYKHILDMSEAKNKPTVWPYMRMAELYLIYAEALLHTGDLPGAIEWVDKVRARVGLAGLVECNPDKNLTNDSKALMEEILRERACELGMEDVRFFDMIRNKRADLFVRQLHGLIIHRADGKEESWSDKKPSPGPRPTEFTYEKFELKNKPRFWWNFTEENFPTKWYLAAFPIVEVNKGYGLTQNPGW